jgi:hypothetical protein
MPAAATAAAGYETGAQQGPGVGVGRMLPTLGGGRLCVDWRHSGHGTKDGGKLGFEGVGSWVWG